MQSKWYELKPKAIKLRLAGKSIKDIENELGIRRSTLSNWFKDVILTAYQKNVLKKKQRVALIHARSIAQIWHRNEKTKRLKIAETKAKNVLQNIDLTDISILKLALAMLYLGEGFKKKHGTGIGNSDPMILKFFLKIIINIYSLNIHKIRFDLHLRADQNPEKIKKFWSKELNVPVERFLYVAIDKRTAGKPTYSTYNGVCLIDCGNIAIQRELVYLSKYFCENVVDNMRA